MGDQQGGDAQLAVQLVEPATQILPDLGVERSEGLVQEEHLRCRREGAGERHTLPLPARELFRVAIRERLQVHELEQLAHPRFAHRLVLLPDAEPEPDVVGDRHVPEQGVVLEHEADAALLHALDRELLVAHHDAAGGRLFQPGDHPEHGALP